LLNKVEIPGLEQSIYFGKELIRENGIAYQDYMIHPINQLQQRQTQSEKNKLKQK
jgi:hypothetical protein